jgi:hypothetical protein
VSVGDAVSGRLGMLHQHRPQGRGGLAELAAQSGACSGACRCASVVPPDPGLHRFGDPPPSPAERFALAQAQPRPAGPACAGLHKGETVAELAAGFGIGTAAWRYVTRLSETVTLLAARAAKLHQAPRHARKAGHACLVTDGTIIPIDRVAAGLPFYSGKHPKHGMNLHVIASPAAISCGCRGRARRDARPDTARIWGIIPRAGRLGPGSAGDKGYIGEDDIRTRTGGGTSPPRRKTPTGVMPGSAP